MRKTNPPFPTVAAGVVAEDVSVGATQGMSSECV